MKAYKEHVSPLDFLLSRIQSLDQQYQIELCNDENVYNLTVNYSSQISYRSNLNFN